jgi:Virulence factor BrkB
MKSLFDTLNIVYGEKEKRSLIKLNAVSLMFTVAGVGFVLIAIGAVVILPVALKYLGLSDFADRLLQVVRWPALFAALGLGLALIYRYGPSRKAPRWRWITRAVRRPQCSGSPHPLCSLGMRLVSATSTRVMATRRRDRFHDLALDFRHCHLARS